MLERGGLMHCILGKPIGLEKNFNVQLVSAESEMPLGYILSRISDAMESLHNFFALIA